jgi:hypothetical protein
MTTAVDVEPIVPVSYQAMRVTDDYLTNIFTLISAAHDAGKWRGQGNPVEGGWLVTINFPDGRPAAFGHPGYWIVADHDLNVDVWDPVAAAAKYHGDVEFDWTGTPTVQLNDDGTATITFRQPDSLNGFWTYVVEQESVVDHGITAAAAVGEPVVTALSDSNNLVLGASVAITFRLSGDAGAGYTFSVTATDFYGKTAGSAPSETVTLPA